MVLYDFTWFSYDLIWLLYRLVASPLGWSSWWTAPTRMINLKTRMIILARKIILVQNFFFLPRAFFFFAAFRTKNQRMMQGWLPRRSVFQSPETGWCEDDTRMTPGWLRRNRAPVWERAHKQTAIAPGWDQDDDLFFFSFLYHPDESSWCPRNYRMITLDIRMIILIILGVATSLSTI